jgi:PhzF family phenazine biosynthesis protein
MEIPFLHIDAFTSEPFKGNPAAVGLLNEPADSEWMQNLAMETNLPVTAFLVRRADGGFDLRWFTPTTELHLCGHGTLATSHALYESGWLSADEAAKFSTQGGWLTAEKRGGLIEMDFPALFSEVVEMPEPVAVALGLVSREVICQRALKEDNGNLLLELKSEESVRSLKPNFDLLRNINSGVIVTARGNSPNYDFVSRYFAGHLGIDEDQVTGSAHCMLAPYWAARLGKDEMQAYQASARGGEVRVRLQGDRVGLGGRAVTVLRGSLV